MNTNSRNDRPHVLVADVLHEDGLSALGEWADVTYAPVRDRIAEKAASVEGLVVRFPIDEATLSEMPNLRAIVRCGAGVDGIPMDYAQTRGIKVSNTPGANADSVAEFVFAGVLQAARNVSSYAHSLVQGNWNARSDARNTSMELHGRRLGILGLGEIGQRVASIGHFGFGMEVQATISHVRQLPDHIKSVDIDTLCKNSDVLVLCCSLTEVTRGLITEERLRSLPPRAILVNVARGAVIDEAGLSSFTSDPERSVALVLDVHHTTPVPVTHPLTRVHLCWLTPHMAGLTHDSERRMGLATNEILLHLLGVSNEYMSKSSC